MRKDVPGNLIVPSPLAFAETVFVSA